MGMLSLIAIVPLLGEVAKVDIRATGPVTNEGALKGMLSTAYAGAGIGGAGTIIPTPRTLCSSTSYATAARGRLLVRQRPGAAQPLQGVGRARHGPVRRHRRDHVRRHRRRGLRVLTRAAAVRRGGGGGGDTSDPAPEPEPAPAPTGGGDDDDDGGGLSTTAIVLIVIGSVLVVGALLYLLWPMLASLCKGASAPASDAAVAMNPTPERVPGTELPPLLTPA